MDHVGSRRIRVSITALALIPLSFNLAMDGHDLQYQISSCPSSGGGTKDIRVSASCIRMLTWLFTMTFGTFVFRYDMLDDLL